MLNLNDIVSLAKQGYKPADIKELIELSRSAEPSGETSEETVNNVEQTEISESVSSNTKQNEDSKEGEEDQIIDYKKKVEDLEKRIADLQKANTKKNIADTDEKSDSEVVFDLARNFM